nr:DeoR/GlpR family DNA-binding transcription regulator [Caldalkalibacillus mannanilyticus]
MYGEERKKQIVEFVNQHGRASVQELCQTYDVSESTIRRDLKELEEEKLIKRAHGGAVSLQSVNFEPSFMEKEDTFKQEKKAIAKKAAELIEEGDTILIDSGTTTFYMIEELKNFSRLTVVTNSLVTALELQQMSTIDVIVLGGALRRDIISLVGPVTNQSLQMIRVDKAFIGTNGLDVQEGLTTPNLMEAETKKQMLHSAKQVIVLADSSKIGKVTFAKVADIERVDKCILDSGVSPHFVQQLEEIGVDVYIAEVTEEIV